MKYICVDTNNYIQCCLLELEGDTLDALKGLYETIEKGEAVLLLPEVIELEFYKVISSKTNKMKKQIGLVEEFVNKNGELDEKIKKDLTEKISICLKEREKNSKDVQEQMKKLFALPNTVRIQLTDSIFIDGYKTFLSGKKPAKLDEKIPIQADTLIVKSLEHYLRDKKDYELYIASGNIEDFANKKPEKISITGEVILHSDISDLFIKVGYFTNIVELLKQIFKKNYSEQDIEKFKEKDMNLTYEIDSSNNDNLVSPSFSVDSPETTEVVPLTSDQSANETL